MERNRSTYIGRQQKNLLLIRPLSQIEAEKEKILKNESVDASNVDLTYTALNLLDHVMECSAFHPGCDPKELVEVGLLEVQKMVPSIDSKDADSIAKRVYDRLRNAKDGYQRFSEAYYDAANQRWAYHDFDYLRSFTDPDDGSKLWLKLGDAAQLVFLGMLEMADEFLEEAELIMMRKAIERGRFDDALQSAVRARKRSISYSVYIKDRLFRAKRSLQNVDWSEKVLPELSQACEHLLSRQKEEDEILLQITEKLSIASEDPVTRSALVSLKNTLEDTQKRHKMLFNLLIKANEDFRNLIRARGFKAHRASSVRDPEREILLPLLSATGSELVEKAPHVWAVLTPPVPPRLFDWYGLFMKTLQEEVGESEVEYEDGGHELVDIEGLAPRYSKETIEQVEKWFWDKLKEGGEVSLSDLVEDAIRDQWPSEHIRLLVMGAVMAWSGIDPRMELDVEIRGRFEGNRVHGDNLVFKRRQE